MEEVGQEQLQAPPPAAETSASTPLVETPQVQRQNILTKALNAIKGMIGRPQPHSQPESPTPPTQQTPGTPSN